MKIDLLALKTLLKTCIKTLEKMKIFSLENLSQNTQEMGYIKAQNKFAR